MRTRARRSTSAGWSAVVTRSRVGGSPLGVPLVTVVVVVQPHSAASTSHGATLASGLIVTPFAPWQSLTRRLRRHQCDRAARAALGDARAILHFAGELPARGGDVVAARAADRRH